MNTFHIGVLNVICFWEGLKAPEKISIGWISGIIFLIIGINLKLVNPTFQEFNRHELKESKDIISKKRPIIHH